MIAIDTNVLVYAHRRDSPFHHKARAAVERCANASAPWAIPFHCLVEFLAVVTSPRIYRPPSSMAQALDQVDAWAESPTLQLLTESGRSSWQVLRSQLQAADAIGARVHDARIATLCVHSDVAELWSVDRDFGRFPELKVKNPFQ